MPRTAKLFKNGRSQAVRLAPDMRFEGSEACIRKGDFLADREDAPPQKRKSF